MARRGEQLRSPLLSLQARQVTLPLELAQGHADISELGTTPAVGIPWWHTESVPGAVLAEEVPGTSVQVASGFVGHREL